MAIAYERVPSETLIPKAITGYVDTGLLGFLAEVAFFRHLILKGPKGEGKTMGIQQYCALNDMPMYRLDCSVNTNETHLIGSYGAEEDGTFKLLLGALTTCIEVANDMGGCVLALEEVNSLPDEQQKLIHPLADFRQEMLVPALSDVLRLAEGSKVWIVGTMNPGYGGTNPIGEALKSRTKTVAVGHMADEHVKTLIYQRLGNQNAESKVLAQKILSLASLTRVAGAGVRYALSTRDVLHFIEDSMQLKSVTRALKLLEGQYDDADHAAFHAKVQTSFKINLTSATLW